MKKILLALLLPLLLFIGVDGGVDARDRRAPISGIVQRHAVLPGSSANYFSSPAAEITSDWTIVAQLTMNDYTPAAEVGIVGQYDINGQRNFLASVLSAGDLKARTSSDGSNENGIDSDAVAGGTDGVEIILRWRYDLDNGAAGKALYSDKWNGSSWDAIGTSPVTVATAVASVFNSTAVISVGGILDGGTLLTVWGGTVKRIQAFNSLNSAGTPFGGATLLWDFNPNDYSGSGTTWISATTGETWTIVGTASVVAD